MLYRKWIDVNRHVVRYNSFWKKRTKNYALFKSNGNNTAQQNITFSVWGLDHERNVPATVIIFATFLARVVWKHAAQLKIYRYVCMVFNSTSCIITTTANCNDQMKRKTSADCFCHNESSCCMLNQQTKAKKAIQRRDGRRKKWEDKKTVKRHKNSFFSGLECVCALTVNPSSFAEWARVNKNIVLFNNSLSEWKRGAREREKTHLASHLCTM